MEKQWERSEKQWDSETVGGLVRVGEVVVGSEEEDEEEDEGSTTKENMKKGRNEMKRGNEKEWWGVSNKVRV